ncbi:MAG: helix-turn-helix domain-containing protein [Agathobacter sp.]|nr:helix-turn-helix domain-containing protein [Agathobacter sp.]
MKKNEDMSLYEAIGKRIRKVREIKEYSRRVLSGMVGISEKHLYNIEMGKVRVGLGMLINICKALGISSDYIINGNADDSVKKLFVDEILE